MEKELNSRKIVQKSTFVVSLIIFISLTGCSKQFARIEGNQAQLQSMIQSNSEHLAAMTEYIEQNQSELIEKIRQVQNETKVVADNVSSLSDEQVKLHETSQNSIKQISNQLYQVSGNQEVLKTGLVVSHNETAKVANILAVLDQKQAELYSTVQNNNNELSEKVAMLEQGQDNLLAGIEDSKNQTLKVSSEVAALGNEQARLYEKSQNDLHQIGEHLNQMSDNQEVLKAGLVVSHNETAKVANNLTVLEQKQADLNSTVQNNNDKLNEKVSLLEQGQSNLLAGIEDSRSQALKVSSEVAALGNEQAKLYESTQNDIRQIINNLSHVSSNQEMLKNGLVVSHNEIAKVANNIVALDQKQSELYNTVQAGNSKLSEKVVNLEQGQNNLLAGIEDSKNQTLGLSTELAALGQEQAKLYESSQNDISQIMNNLSQVSGNQEVLKVGLVVSHNETAKVANNVAALGEKQLELNENSQKDILQLANNLSEIIQNQSILKTGLVVSHNETAKVGNNVSSLGQIQKELSDIIQNSNTQLSQRVAMVEQNQSDLQAGFEKMQNETREVADNISSIGQDQMSLQETVNTYSQQMSERVDSIEQNRQEWQVTIQQMQESVQQVAGNIGTFEQNLSKLQDILQSKMGDLIAVSNTNNKEQTEFQEKMRSDLLALADSVNVIKQSQSQLQQKIEDVQSKTESMAIEFPVAIEQLRKEITIDEEAYSSDK